MIARSMKRAYHPSMAISPPSLYLCTYTSYVSFYFSSCPCHRFLPSHIFLSLNSLPFSVLFVCVPIFWAIAQGRGVVDLDVGGGLILIGVMLTRLLGQMTFRVHAFTRRRRFAFWGG